MNVAEHAGRSGVIVSAVIIAWVVSMPVTLVYFEHDPSAGTPSWMRAYLSIPIVCLVLAACGCAIGAIGLCGHGKAAARRALVWNCGAIMIVGVIMYLTVHSGT